MSRVTILGVPIDPVTMEEALGRIRAFLASKEQHHVMTPNSEMLVRAARNPIFASVLQRSALNLPDSQGLLWAAKKTRQHLPERVTGVDAVTQLCRTLDEECPVFFLGARDGVAAKAAEHLKNRNPKLSIAGVFSGSPRPEDAPEILRRINDAKAHLLLVAFGAPEQDLWIDRHLKELPTVRVAMGIGGTFDFLAGRARRAPEILRRQGLEWAWRFFQEPWRLQRILTATIVFPLLVLRYGKNDPAHRS